MKLPLGLIQWTEGTDGRKLEEYVLRLESLGFEELWLPEIAGREPFSTAGYLLAKTTKIKISSGIANVYARDADASAQAANTLNEFSDGRFSLGLGVSHPLLVEPRGHEWVPPVKKMNSYLDRLKDAPLQSPLASKPAEIVIAGHAPGLQKVAANKADGLFLFLQTVETVKNAKAIIGPEKSLPVAVRCVLDDNPTSARDLARKACAFYMSLPAYHRVWSSLGFEEADWSNGGSDRLVDAICAWGDSETIKKKLKSYIDAGATQLVIYPCNPGEDYKPDSALSVGWHWELLEALS
ncbi:MAG: hypothetical protein CBC29_08635 [Methylococcaceae bacterium TMED69]|nr:MAG: hypothetical protein CBC29_08635 [Methylococcaceae bacterium TMED69]|tara:strand:+ start:3439 stop:4323 length:885 start_codon:yes stop_codon:yes gene_type:complete